MSDLLAFGGSVEDQLWDVNAPPDGSLDTAGVYVIRCVSRALDHHPSSEPRRVIPYKTFDDLADRFREDQGLPVPRTKSDRFDSRYQDDIPAWLYAAYKSDMRVYVGCSDNVRWRIRGHVFGQPDDSALFTRMFSPAAVIDVDWYPHAGKERLCKKEAEKANELRGANSDWFVYQA